MQNCLPQNTKMQESRMDTDRSDEHECQCSQPVAGRRRLLTGGLAAAPVILTAASKSALAAECLSPSRVFSGNISPHGDNFTCGGRSPGFWKTAQHLPVWATLNAKLPVPVTAPILSELTMSGWVVCSESGAGSPSYGSFMDNPYKKGSHRIGGMPPQFGTSFAAVFGPTSGMVPVVPDPDSPDNPMTSATDRTINPGRPLCLWEVLAYPNRVGGGSDDSGTPTPMVQAARHLIAAYLNSAYVSGYPLTGTQVIDIWQQLVGTGSYCPTAGCASPWGPQEVTAYIAGTFQ